MGLSGLPGFGCLFISPLLGKFSIIIFSNIFLCFFFLSSSGTSISQILEPLKLSQRSLKLFSIPFSLSQILLCFRYFHHSIFQLTYLAFFVCLFTSVILLLVPSNVLFHLLLWFSPLLSIL